MEFVILSLLLFATLFYLLHCERRENRRLAREKDLPGGHRLPRHYRSFMEVEKKLWAATESLRQAGAWESTSVTVQSSEVKIVREYLRGLHEDFARGNRIYVAVIRHAPEMSLLAQLEWQRLRIHLSFYFLYRIVSWRLKLTAVSLPELRRLTDIVATLAYEVRTMLSALQQSGDAEFVESILKNA